MARQRTASVICASSESQFFSHTAPGAIDTASRVRGNPDSRLDTNSLSCQDPARGSRGEAVLLHVLIVPMVRPADKRRARIDRRGARAADRLAIWIRAGATKPAAPSIRL